MDSPDRDPTTETAGDPGKGFRWLAALLLPVPVGLGAWRIAGLGIGTLDLVPHFLLDLLVSACMVPLLLGPLRGRPPLPLLFTTTLILLALYVGWLYLPAGLGTAALLGLVTLLTGILLRWLRERLSVATFLRSGWMEELDLAAGDVPADAVHTRDPLTGGHARTWRRYVAFPVIAGLLLSFLAVRVARPLDKREEVRSVVSQGEPFEIGRAALKAAVNGNALLFIRERLVWFVKPGAPGSAMDQAAEFYDSYAEQCAQLGVQWLDLGTLQAVGTRAGTPGDSPNRNVQTYAGRAVAWLDDPEAAPDGLTWIDPRRPWSGFHAWIDELQVTLEKTPDGWRVVSLPETLRISLRKP